ncbi:unnamed protein product [Protopolystoma xenopodis]|uniref:Uncharacterized protein n=1 Tax=Protopolystoma xenopodis TaxID=117903 RepID=A0A3S5BR34_9PLAT|nr:unnamed protein product [Protopolystoma xenopodis]
MKSANWLSRKRKGLLISLHTVTTARNDAISPFPVRPVQANEMKGPLTCDYRWRLRNPAAREAASSSGKIFSSSPESRHRDCCCQGRLLFIASPPALASVGIATKATSVNFEEKLCCLGAYSQVSSQ